MLLDSCFARARGVPSKHFVGHDAKGPHVTGWAGVHHLLTICLGRHQLHHKQHSLRLTDTAAEHHLT